MKPSSILRWATCLSVTALLFISCNKFDLSWKDLKKKHKKEFQVKTWQEGSRTYNFYYDKKGEVDSIVAVDRLFSYVYRVHRKAGRITQVDLFNYSSGVLESSNTDFEYDQKKRVVGYNYIYHVNNPDNYKVPHAVTYDGKGRMYPDQVSSSIVYDANNDIISGSDEAFTYDQYLNPLAQVPDLFFIMLEEPGYWWLILPEHNSTTALINGSFHTIENQYDNYGRLISKTEPAVVNSPVVSSSFTY